jgi:type VI secretion system protein ImpH
MTDNQLSSALTEGVTKAPWEADLFALLRRIDAAQSSAPRLGRAALPTEEPVRITQATAPIFAPASIGSVGVTSTNQINIEQYLFGYLGPNGPLPDHLKEWVHQRAHSYNDSTQLAFLNMLQHRFALHFYRAWTQSKPAVSRDRPNEDFFGRWVDSLGGIDSLPHHLSTPAQRYFVGITNRGPKNSERIEAILAFTFGVKVKVQQWIGQWMAVSSKDQAAIGLVGVGKRIGLSRESGPIGSRVWDRQHGIRIHLLNLTLVQFDRFAHAGQAIAELKRWVNQLTGHDVYWDLCLHLQAREVPKAHLGVNTRLGWLAWIGSEQRMREADDVKVRSID